MQNPVTVKSLYECQLYHLHREDEDNSHNGVGVMVGVEVGGDGAGVGCFWWMRIFVPYDHSKLLQRG